MAATKTKQEITPSNPSASKAPKTGKKTTAKTSKNSAAKSKTTNVEKSSKTTKVAKSTKPKAPKAKTANAKTANAKTAKTKAAKTKTAKTKTAKTKTAKIKTAKTKTSKIKSTAKKTTTKRKSIKVKTGKNTVATFLAGIVKQATKVQKQAQTETKAWIKSLNSQDKQLSQLTKKASKATAKGKASIEKKINKLQSEMSVTRTGLLNAENATDKVATLIEWVAQLNAKPAVTAFLRPTTSKPSLVKNTPSNTKKTSPAPAPYEEEDYLEENDEEMNFLFGEDDDEEATR